MLGITAINVDGLDLISDVYYFNIDGLFSNDNDVITSDLYGDGQSFDHTKHQMKKIILSGYVKTRNTQQFMTLRQILCTEKLKTFTITIPNLGQLTFKAEVTNFGKGGTGYFTISCQLVMPDPYIYKVSPFTLDLGAISNNLLTFPFNFPIVFGSYTGSTGDVLNMGNATAYPIIKVIGSCSNIIITNTTTGESINTGSLSLTDSDTLIIDNTPATRSIKLNGVSRMDLKQGNWISCTAGDNYFNFNRSSIEMIKHCNISLNWRWI